MLLAFKNDYTGYRYYLEIPLLEEDDDEVSLYRSGICHKKIEKITIHY